MSNGKGGGVDNSRMCAKYPVVGDIEQDLERALELVPHVEERRRQLTWTLLGGEPQVLEGDRKVERIVLVEFDSPQKAHDFYHSADYQAVIDYRFKSADTHLYLLQGTPSG